MAITAYLDESGTHGDESPSMIMAGYIADSAQWTAFEKEFREHLAAYGVDVYHAKKLRGSKGPFKGWAIEKKGKFHQEMVGIIDRNLVMGFAATLSPKDYYAFYKDEANPPQIREDTQYSVCFRACLLFATKYALSNRHKGELNLVLESGAKNSGDAVRLFHEFKADLKPQYHGLLGAISLDSKEACPMLAPADMLAHIAFRVEAGPTPEAYAEEATYHLDDGRIERLPARDADGHIPLVKMPITEQTLKDLKGFLHIRHEEKMRRKAAAKRAR